MPEKNNLGWRRLLATTAATVSTAVCALGIIAHHPGWQSVSAHMVLVAAFPTALLIGLWCAPRLGISLVAIMTIVLELDWDHVTPFVPVVYAGPWLIGYLLRSRRLVGAQLELRAHELAAEREIFAQESVRYERARIARELHDIVAHCISVMVVQASAGNRLVGTDPDLAAESFGHIAEAARQAQQEMGQLLALLDTTSPPSAAGLRFVDELVARARATGLPVTCRFTGRTDQLPPQRAETAYRLVQEALTNALKHAPGAPVVIDVAGSDRAVNITVTNEAPAHPPTWLQGMGGGHGLRGMRERAASCGGDLEIGPRPDGGWQVALALPV